MISLVNKQDDHDYIRMIDKAINKIDLDLTFDKVSTVFMNRMLQN